MEKCGFCGKKMMIGGDYAKDGVVKFACARCQGTHILNGWKLVVSQPAKQPEKSPGNGHDDMFNGLGADDGPNGPFV